MNNPDKINENIGRRVAEIRLELGLTQDALAEKAGVTGGYIRQIEGGWKNMRVQTLCKVADILGCPVRTLFDTPTLPKPASGRPRLKPQGKASFALAAEPRSLYQAKTASQRRPNRKK